MCIGQVGNLLPHVTLSANLAQHLMPAWGLSAAEGGLMASGYAFGYMLAVPLLTTLTDRIDARLVLLWGSIVSGLATAAFGIFAQGFWSATAIWSPGRAWICRRLHAGPEGADGPASPRRHLARRDAVHVELLGRRRPLVPGRASDRRPLGMADRFPCHRLLSDRNGRRVPSDAGAAARAEGGTSVELRASLRQPRGARIHLRLRRPLLRALRYPHLAGRVLDLRRRPSRRAVVVEPRRAELLFCGDLDAGQHPRQRGRAEIRPPSRDHGRDDRVGLRGASYRPQHDGAGMGARTAAARLWPDRAGGFRRVDRRHVGRGRNRTSRRDPGPA